MSSAAISPDIEQWLLMDEKVVRKWRSLAIRLGLSDYILDIDCWRGGASAASGTSRRRRGSREKDKMELFMKVWRETKPELYTVTHLKTLLSAEGLSDMWMWINIITNKASSGSSPVSPGPRPGLSSSRGWSRHLYTGETGSSVSHSSYADSDYSLPHSPASTRPSSQVSYYTSSCPTTPLSHRRHDRDQSMMSPYRTSHSSSSTRSGAPSGVFHTLFRPDLIKLSDPRRRRRHSEDESESCSVRSVPIILDRSSSSRNSHHHQTSRMSMRKSPLNLSTSSNHISANNRAGFLSPPPIRGQEIMLSQSRTNSYSHDPDINEQKIMQRKISDDCDQLLRDLELDMAAMSQMNGNSNKNLNTIKRSPSKKVSDVNSTVSSPKYHQNNKKQTFYINKVKMVELHEDHQLLDNYNSSKKVFKTHTEGDKYVENNYSVKADNQEYFDSLIRLIENAARNLSD